MSDDGTLDLDLLLSSLDADASDTAAYFSALAVKLHDVLGNRLSVERERVGGLLRRQEGAPRKLVVDLGEDHLEAERTGSSVRCTSRHTVRGIVLRNDEIDFAEWLQRLMGALVAEAQKSDATRTALEALVVRGEAPSGPPADSPGSE